MNGRLHDGWGHHGQNPGSSLPAELPVTLSALGGEIVDAVLDRPPDSALISPLTHEGGYSAPASSLLVATGAAELVLQPYHEDLPRSEIDPQPSASPAPPASEPLAPGKEVATSDTTPPVAGEGGGPVKPPEEPGRQGAGDAEEPDHFALLPWDSLPVNVDGFPSAEHDSLEEIAATNQLYEHAISEIIGNPYFPKEVIVADDPRVPTIPTASLDCELPDGIATARVSEDMITVRLFSDDGEPASSYSYYIADDGRLRRSEHGVSDHTRDHIPSSAAIDKTIERAAAAEENTEVIELERRVGMRDVAVSLQEMQWLNSVMEYGDATSYGFDELEEEAFIAIAVPPQEPSLHERLLGTGMLTELTMRRLDRGDTLPRQSDRRTRYFGGSVLTVKWGLVRDRPPQDIIDFVRDPGSPVITVSLQKRFKDLPEGWQTVLQSMSGPKEYAYGDPRTGTIELQYQDIGTPDDPRPVLRRTVILSLGVGQAAARLTDVVPAGLYHLRLLSGFLRPSDPHMDSIFARRKARLAEARRPKTEFKEGNDA